MSEKIIERDPRLNKHKMMSENAVNIDLRVGYGGMMSDMRFSKKSRLPKHRTPASYENRGAESTVQSLYKVNSDMILAKIDV